jgi:hypothetical protein
MRLLVLCALVAADCAGATGDHLVTFSAAAAGPADIAGNIEFDSPAGFRVRLDRARLHIGAVYLSQARPLAGSQETSCLQAVEIGVYVGQVTQGLDVDLLSPTPQPFPVSGEGTTVAAKSGEIWLTGGDVNAEADTTVILDIAGLATRNADQFPFQGAITIGKNWALPSPASTMPGAHPICKQRIVTPIAVDLALDSGGTLLVRADPRALFGSSVDFSALRSTVDGVYRFDDGRLSTVDLNLYTSLHSASLYSFAWVEAAP